MRWAPCLPSCDWQPRMTDEQLKVHRNIGNMASAFRGHPMCEFCKLYLYDDEGRCLLTHCSYAYGHHSASHLSGRHSHLCVPAHFSESIALYPRLFFGIAPPRCAYDSRPVHTPEPQPRRVRPVPSTHWRAWPVLQRVLGSAATLLRIALRLRRPSVHGSRSCRVHG